MNDLPDVTDPDIRAMVLRDHQPEETWIRWPASASVSVYCGTCFGEWPCPSIKAAREYEG